MGPQLLTSGQCAHRDPNETIEPRIGTGDRVLLGQTLHGIPATELRLLIRHQQVLPLGC
jgi:hypothetical protein